MTKSRIITGFLAVAIGVLAGSTSVANAQGSVGTPNPPTSTADCKNGGWRTKSDTTGALFKNQGQCVKFANQSGYGGTVNVGVSTNVNGNGNVITNIINFFVGGSTNVNLGVSTNVDGDRNFVNNVVRFIFG